jgi:hypothetical protein
VRRYIAPVGDKVQVKLRNAILNKCGDRRQEVLRMGVYSSTTV